MAEEKKTWVTVVLYDHFRKAANIKGKKTVQFKSSVKDVK
jgi:hypothetical protein